MPGPLPLPGASASRAPRRQLAHPRPPSARPPPPRPPPPQIGKALGAQWKELSEEGKKPYVAQAEADKVRYAAAKEVYEAGKAGGGGGDAAAEEESD